MWPKAILKWSSVALPEDVLVAVQIGLFSEKHVGENLFSYIELGY
jgi:hypothetical protein